ncbi:MAG: glutamate-1-semialdehyde 2,1-aminomutase [Candidatus Omnitrophota bacterium]
MRASKISVSKSELLWKQAKRFVPGGVNSPVRAFRAVGGTPRFIEKAFGSKLCDVDGNVYIDFVMGWGPFILGHAHPDLTETLHKTLLKGTSFGTPTQGEVELAQRIHEAMPALEKIRLVNSGTEAVMTALRLARAYTQREKIVKFEGCYHGHTDALLVGAGSGSLSLSIPTSAGIPKEVLTKTVVLPYNDLTAIRDLFQKEGGEIACVIVEPVAANMGVIPPKPGFLERLRALTMRYRSLLIFDEVITGFRVAHGGAQVRYGVVPDLTTLGKIIGGGLPIGAVGGKRSIVDLLAPEGPVYQAGTLSGNSLSVAGGNKVLQILERKRTYQTLEEKGAFLEAAFRKAFSQKGIPGCVNRVGSLLSPFFGVTSVWSFGDLRTMDKKAYKRFFHGSLEKGLYFPPSPYEASFLSLAHSDCDLKKSAAVIAEVIGTLRGKDGKRLPPSSADLT